MMLATASAPRIHRHREQSGKTKLFFAPFASFAAKITLF